MILKPNVKLTYNITTRLIHFEYSRDLNNKYDLPKKIMSRQVPELLGINDFNSIGKAILDRMNFLKKETIDPYYTIRGSICEYFAKKYLETLYLHKNIILNIKEYDTKTENYDMFRDNKRFGGVIDLKIFSPFEAVVEVKSKSFEKFSDIAKNGKYPKEETKQGEVLTYLSKCEKLIMAYVFITDECEEKLKKYVEDKRHNDWTYAKKLDGTFGKPQQKSNETMIKELNMDISNFRFHLKPIIIDPKKIEIDMHKCWDVLNLYTNNMSDSFDLPIDLFKTKNKKDLEQIKRIMRGEI